MALRGNLNDFSLPDVFQLVTFSQKTGVLRINRENGDEGSVWFRDGDVFFAQSNWHASLLGERLVRAHKITNEALARALEIRVLEGPDGRRLGAILTQENYISHAVLESFVQEQIQETIFDLMRWDEGNFDFQAMPEVAEEDIGLSVSIENVIMEGSRRFDEWGRIRKKIPSMDVVFKMATAPGEGSFAISLKPIEWNLLLLVDGTRSVADMARETGRSDFDVSRIVYGLFSAGLIEFTGDDEIQRLRAEKRERDAHVAQARAVRRAAEDVARADAVEREAVLEASARARAEAETRAKAESDSSAGVASRAVDSPFSSLDEEPLFFGAQLPGPTGEDAAVLEEMMDAVLQHSATAEPEMLTSPAIVSAPEIPTPPEIVSAPEIPPVAEIVVAPEIVEPPQVESMTWEHAESGPVDVSEIVSIPEVPGLNLPLMPVLSVEQMLSDLSPIETSEQSTEEALVAVAAAATLALDREPESPFSEIEPVAAAEFVWESAPEPELAPEPVPDPDPAPEPEPEPDTDPDPALPMAADNVSSYELELRSLGLGELPSDLFGVAPVANARELRPEELAHSGSIVFDLDAELPSEEQSVTQEAIIVADEVIDLSVLLESLDAENEVLLPEDSSQDADPFDTTLPVGPEAGILPDLSPPASVGKVISTQAFMDEMPFEAMGLSGGMSDELSALTGADRHSRPVVNVAGIPDRPSGVIKRDPSVDVSTLLKIIDGIKNL